MGLLRRAGAAAVLVVLGTLVGLLLVEAADRLRLLPCFDVRAPVWEPHPVLGWFHRAGASGWGQGCLDGRVEWRAAIAINGRGLPGPERPWEKPPGTRRILVLGDSYAEGYTVAHDARFDTALERRLAGGSRVEVLNAAVSAWSTDQQLLFYATEGRRYAPDVVVLAFHPLNDVAENVPRLGRGFARGAVKPYFELEDGRLVARPFVRRVRSDGWRVRLDGALRGHTHVYPLARHLVGRSFFRWRRRARPPAPPAPRPGAPPGAGPAPPPPVPVAAGFAQRELPPEWTEAWRLTQALVRELRARVEADGHRFVVATVPSKWAVGGPRITFLMGERRPEVDLTLPEARAEAFLAATGIASCPLLPAFRAHLARTGRNGFHLWDIHWDAEGHAVVAEALAACLAPLGGAPGDGSPSARADALEGAGALG